MFTLPPRPPKDYILKDVLLNQTSAAEQTPLALPRATQTTLAKYCFPIEARDNEPADKSEILEICDPVLNRITDKAKANWVDRPEENAFFINDLFKKHRVVVEPDYNPQYKHRPRVFERSYKYEFDCIEEARLQKLRDKMKREEKEDGVIYKEHDLKLESQQQDDTCKRSPPFWWEASSVPEPEQKQTIRSEFRVKSDESTYQTSYLRWQQMPRLFDVNQVDPCKRREAFAQIRKPFKHEACNWYFKNYPPPNIKFRPEKFGK